MIAKAPIVDAKSNLMMIQDCLYETHFSWKCDTFKIDNVSVHHVLSKIFMDMDACVQVKQRKSMQDGGAVFFNIHKQFLCPEHAVRQAVEAEKKTSKCTQ